MSSPEVTIAAAFETSPSMSRLSSAYCPYTAMASLLQGVCPNGVLGNLGRGDVDDQCVAAFDKAQARRCRARTQSASAA